MQAGVAGDMTVCGLTHCCPGATTWELEHGEGLLPIGIDIELQKPQHLLDPA